jgi:hypothetical protein
VTRRPCRRYHTADYGDALCIWSQTRLTVDTNWTSDEGALSGMQTIQQFDALWTEAGLRATGIGLPALFEYIMQHGVAIMRHVYPAEQLTDLKEDVHRWGLGTPTKPPQTPLDDNYHAIESGISPRQRTPHNYHGYTFDQLGTLAPTELSRKLAAIFGPLQRFQNELTGNNAGFVRDGNGPKLHPQAIHYPTGGGMFGKHIHSLEPQRIGLILGLSERGRDFQCGATHFEIDGNDVGTDDVHDIGDMILFRFDVPHWITPVDANDVLDYSSSRGRWTAVLPYY